MNESALEAASPDRSLETCVPQAATLEPLLRRSEWVLVLYFTYTSLLAVHFSLSLVHCAVAFAIPALLMALAYADGLHPRFATSVVRDWLPVPLILVAYWQVDWFFTAAYLRDLERSWLTWDHTILYQNTLGGTWQTLITVPAATSPATSTSYSDAASAGMSQRFYKVQVGP